MKVIIAGSRTITDMTLVEKAVVESGFTITEEVCGLARGVDELGRIWALRNNIPVKTFPANWAKFGKSAGYKRNKEMVDYADALIAVTTGSTGTQHTIDLAKEKGLPSFIVKI